MRSRTHFAQVGEDLVNKNAAQLAADAQKAHNDYANVKGDVILAGNDVSDNDQIGRAENKMDDGINELKNGMDALVAFAEEPTAGNLGSANSQLASGVADWDQGLTVIWRLAGDASDAPTLTPASSSSTSTTSATATPTTTAPAPGSSAASAVAPHINGLPTPDRTQVCGSAITTGPDTSCGFAENVYNVVSGYWRQKGQIPANVTAYSPVTSRMFSASCAVVGGAEITCNTTTGGSVTLNAPPIESQIPKSFSPTPEQVAEAEKALPDCHEPGTTLRGLEQAAAGPLGIQC
jgi:hypothetical protein